MSTLTLIPRHNDENNREYSYRMLRYNIMTLKLLPGETINEGELCHLLSFSRTPVHEALSLLKAEGLVTIIPQSGSHITKINLKNVREGLFFRSTIEPAMIRQIAGNISPESLDLIHKTLTDMESLLSDPETDHISNTTIIDLDNEFHKAIYFASQKNIIWEAQRSICSHYDRIRYQGSLEKVDNLELVCTEHRKIYEYLLLGGNPGFDIDTFYSNHLSHFKNYFPKLYHRHPEYFTRN